MKLNSVGLECLRTFIMLAVFATIAVALRFLARWKSRFPFGADDFLIAVSLAFLYGWTADLIVGTLGKVMPIVATVDRYTAADYSGGIGRHVSELNKSQYTRVLRVNIICHVLDMLLYVS